MTISKMKFNFCWLVAVVAFFGHVTASNKFISTPPPPEYSTISTQPPVEATTKAQNLTLPQIVLTANTNVVIEGTPFEIDCSPEFTWPYKDYYVRFYFSYYKPEQVPDFREIGYYNIDKDRVYSFGSSPTSELYIITGTNFVDISSRSFRAQISTRISGIYQCKLINFSSTSIKSISDNLIVGNETEPTKRPIQSTSQSPIPDVPQIELTSSIVTVGVAPFEIDCSPEFRWPNIDYYVRFYYSPLTLSQKPVFKQIGYYNIYDDEVFFSSGSTSQEFSVVLGSSFVNGSERSFRAQISPLTIEAAGIYRCELHDYSSQATKSISNSLTLEDGAFPEVDQLEIASSTEKLAIGKVYDVSCSAGELLSSPYKMIFLLGGVEIGNFSASSSATNPTWKTATQLENIRVIKDGTSKYPNFAIIAKVQILAAQEWSCVLTLDTPLGEAQYKSKTLTLS